MTSPASERVPEMVERVMRAICCPDGNCPAESFGLECGQCRKHEEEARAAIAAMRELPFPLKQAGRDAWISFEDQLRAQDYTHGSRIKTVGTIWQSVIDEALR